LENDFPIHASFVPFIENTSRYLGRLDAGPASTMVGDFAELRDRELDVLRFRWTKPRRRRTYSSQSRASTISGGPTGATNWSR